MKKFLLATVGLAVLGMAAPASAADLAARPYTKAPPPVIAPIYDWTGFYIGANGGWGSAHNCWSAGPVGGVLVADGCSNQSGGLFGGQLGYRWQTNQFVFGLEGQGDWANLSQTRFSTINPLISEQAKVDGIGLLTGQVGWAWNSALLYFKGGAAVTGNRFSLCDTANGLLWPRQVRPVGAVPWVSASSMASPRTGRSVVEYDHLFMGDSNNYVLGNRRASC